MNFTVASSMLFRLRYELYPCSRADALRMGFLDIIAASPLLAEYYGIIKIVGEDGPERPSG